MSLETAQRAPGKDAVVLSGDELTVEMVVRVARHGARVELGAEAYRRLVAARDLVEDSLGSGETIYGINSGFGNLSRVRIPEDDLKQLQRNLLLSHAAGVGDPLPREIVRGMILLLAASLSRGHSGVRPVVVERLLDLLNMRMTPVVPSQGSLGASGDLAPLAHLALALIGRGEVETDSGRIGAAEALAQEGVIPLALEAKEGLALINGTHLMAAGAALAVHDSGVLIESAEVAAAMAVDALRGSGTPFDARIHAVRRQRGQAIAAMHLRDLLEGSEIIPSHRLDDTRVQDPYSLRCVPQVLGAIRDALQHATSVVEAELGAVTDNPLCFPEQREILSGGNFHGQPLALVMDFLALALAELGAFSERRIYLLLDDHQPEPFRLPPFLARDAGLNSGYMIAQYVAAALVAENAVLATPASLHSVPTSAGMEDFVSMGATAAGKLRTIVANTSRILAIELLCAAEGLEYRRPLRSGVGVEAAHDRVRQVIPPLLHDRELHADIEAVAGMVGRGHFVL